MPDVTLTWYNLKEHIRKFGWVYVVVIAVTLVAGNLLWISTTPRVPEDERVLIYLADQWSNPEYLEDLSAAVLEKVQTEDDTVREVAFEGLLFADPAQDYTGVMVLMTRLAVGEGDVFFANENAMNALVNSGACLPLDDYWESGWMNGTGLEPYYATVADEETGETNTFMAGLRLDSLDALMKRQAFNNEGAYLVVAASGTNIESSMRVAEIVVETLVEEG